MTYAFEGVSEMVEAGIGYNYIREKIFNGNEEAYEESNGAVGLKEVVQTFVKEADELVHVTVKGKEKRS